jgi:hypothetical protein
MQMRDTPPEREMDVQRLLDDLDELQEVDRRRRLEPRNSQAYERAAREVDRRSKALIDRLRSSGGDRSEEANRSEGGTL